MEHTEPNLWSIPRFTDEPDYVEPDDVGAGPRPKFVDQPLAEYLEGRKEKREATEALEGQNPLYSYDIRELETDDDEGLDQVRDFAEIENLSTQKRLLMMEIAMCIRELYKLRDISSFIREISRGRIVITKDNVEQHEMLIAHHWRAHTDYYWLKKEALAHKNARLRMKKHPITNPYLKQQKIEQRREKLVSMYADDDDEDKERMPPPAPLTEEERMKRSLENAPWNKKRHEHREQAEREQAARGSNDPAPAPRKESRKATPPPAPKRSGRKREDEDEEFFSAEEEPDAPKTLVIDGVTYAPVGKAAPPAPEAKAAPSKKKKHVVATKKVVHKYPRQRRGRKGDDQALD